MKRTNISFYILFIFLVTSFLNSNAQSIDALLEEGEKYYKLFDNEKTLEAFKKVEKIDANNFEALWKLSRTYIDIADRMPTSTDEQERAQLAIFQKAFECADQACKKEPNQSVGYLQRSIANGKIALFKGVFTVAGIVNSVRADVEKAIKLDNGGNFNQGVAHYVLARTHAKTSEKWKPARVLMGLGWADNEVAIAEYKKAIQLYPTYVMFYVDYALSLIREDDYKTAREMLNKALASPIQHQDDEKRLAEAKILLNDIKNH